MGVLRWGCFGGGPSPLGHVASASAGRERERSLQSKSQASTRGPTNATRKQAGKEKRNDRKGGKRPGRPKASATAEGGCFADGLW